MGYGCPYLLARDPDTYLSYDLSVVTHPNPMRMRDVEYLASAPLLAIEIKELDEDEDLLLRTIECSLQLGVQEMWYVDPFDEIVVCHSPHSSPKYVNGRMELIGGSALPNFRCSVEEVFE
jgi:Uma2 family endonuclease